MGIRNVAGRDQAGEKGAENAAKNDPEIRNR
jgi:hypothetical protein